MTNGNGLSISLPSRAGTVGVTAKDNRLFLEAVLYRYRTGIPWRDLSSYFGNWSVVHTRFSHWAKSGLYLKFSSTWLLMSIMNVP